MSKYKILVLPSDKFGVGYFRSLAPHLYLDEHYNDDFEVDIDYNPNLDNLNEFDQYQMVHFHKRIGYNAEKGFKALEYLKSKGIKTVIDIDDYWDLGQYHPAREIHAREGVKDITLKYIKMADYVTTTTPLFANEIKKHNKNVFVIPNAINPEEKQFIPQPTKSDRLRFGIICGSSHEHDIALLEGLTNQLPQDILNKIQIVLCGFDLRGTIEIYNVDTKELTKRPILPQESVWYKYEKILTDNYKIVSDDYEKFLKKFIVDVDYPNTDNEPYRRCWTKPINEYATHYNNIDVLLVPLKECPFNKVKSQLKVIEAGFFNKAIIAQNYGPYTLDLVPMIERGGKINESGNSLLVESSKNHKQWAKYIERLVKNPEMVTALQQNLHDTVKDKYSLETVTKLRAEIYNNILKS